MRALSSAFTLGRGGRSDSTSSRSVNSQNAPVSAHRLNKARSTSLFAKAPKTPVETTTHSYSRPDLTRTPNSSASSDGSASLRTPEDEGVMSFSKTEDKKRWPNWLTSWRKHSDKTIHDATDMTPSSSQTTTVSIPDPSNSLRQQLQHHRNGERNESDTENEDSSSDDSDSHANLSGFSPRSISATQIHVPSHQARSNLRALLRNRLVNPPSPPPLVEIPSALPFPRSITNVNAQHPKGRPRSFEANMLTFKLLKRLDRGDLTPTETRSISYFANRSQPKPTLRRVGPVLEKKAEDVVSYPSMRIGRYSRGLRKWAARPCFEQRFSVWQSDEYGKLSCKSVAGVGRGLAVLDLEFSERLIVLAGLDLDDETFERELFPPLSDPKKPVYVPNTRQHSEPSSQVTSRKASIRASPPLSLEHSTLAEPVLSTISSFSSMTVEPSASQPILDTRQTTSSQDMNETTSVNNATQRGVRFAANAKDNDDDIPLGYALRAKKQKEEKERFLQAEREKRAKERASTVYEAPEKSRQAKALSFDDQRVLEEQKRAEEARRRVDEERRLREERQRAKYNEEVTASRRRRESARLGMDNYVNIRESHQMDKAPTYSRPAYDESNSRTILPRRQASDHVISSGNRSMNNLRQANSVETGDRNRNSTSGLTRTSMYASSEDVRNSNSRRQSTISEHSDRTSQRPASIVSTSTRRHTLSRTQSVPMQIPLMPYAIPIVPVVPPVPPIPAIPVWNMPLLPPNAPFMMQSYSRSPSPGSGGSSPHSRNSSPSRRQSIVPQSRSQQSLSSTPPSPASRHSRNGSGEGSLPRQHSASSVNHSSQSSGGYRKPLRSESYSPVQSSSLSPQVPMRNENYRKSAHGSSNLRPPESKRRTTMM